MIDQFVIPLVKILIVLNATLVAVTYMVLLERKVIAWAQSRLGPMRVGPYGVLQPVADAIKLMIKEDITPVRADKWVFTAAPIISMVPALIVYAVIPFGPVVSLFGRQVSLYITDINVGLLYIVSVASVGVYGIILAGYASNSKYPLLASLRASAQLISYEVAVTLTLVSVILMSGTLSMVGIVDAQYNSRVWFAFVQPVAFVVFFIGGLAETNRAPFDMPEAEQELTGGFHTEYSGMRFALFFLAEYANMIVVSSVATTLFFGGWLRPFPNVAALGFLGHHSELGLVPDQVVRVPLHLHLGARHAAALPLRPADAARMEGADSAGDREPGGHRHREGVDGVMGQAIAFYTLAAFILGFAVLVVTTKDTVHSVLFLVLDFLFVGGALRAARRAVSGRHPGPRLRRRHRRAVSVRRHAGEPEAAAGGAPRSAPPDEAGVFPLGRRAAGARRHLRVSDDASGPRRAGSADAGDRQHRAGGLAAVHELSDSVRDRVDAAAGGDDRRDRAGEKGTEL